MTHKENITAILECYFTGFKKEIIDSACNRILEQERCEDAISRQAVLNMQYRIDDSATLSTRDVVNVDDIKDLPPVTPKQQTCEDAVSRQAAIDTIESWLSCDDYNEAERHIMRAMQSVLYDLPSVTPKTKTIIEALEKTKEEIKQIRLRNGYIDVQGLTIIKVLEIIDKHISEIGK